MGKYYLGTGNQQINFQVVDSTGVISDLNLSGLYLSVTGKATDADKLDNYDSSFFRNAQNLTGIYTGQISGSIGNADTLDGLDSSYFLNGANITGTVSLSGTFTGYYTGAFSGTITHTDYIQFHTGLGINPDPAELTWDDNVGTMQLGLDANVDLRVGFQNYEFVANRNASTLSKGSVVYISGAQGNRPAVALALANADSTSAVTFGILAEDISSMADGYAITNGLLTNLNTTGFAEGAALYLSPTVSGAIISSKPQAPNHSVLVGFCVRSHASAGEILVKIQNGVELDELHDVRIISAQNNDIIRYNAPSGVWFNSNTLALNGTGSHYISGDLGIGTSSPNAKLHIFGADKRQIISSTTDNAALVLGQWDGATNRIESSTRKLLITSYASGISLGVNGSENVHVSTSGNLGIGTTSPQFKLDVNGASVFRDTINVGPNIGTISWGSMGGGSGFGIRAESGRGFSLGSNGNWDYVVINTSGNVGIGTTTPTAKLEVNGSISLTGDIRNAWGDRTFAVTQYPDNYGTSPSYYMGFKTDATTRQFYIDNKNSDGAATDPNGAIIFRTGPTPTSRMIVSYGGNVGIGTTSPLTILNLSGGGGAVYQTFTDTTNAYHHGYIGKNGGGLVFGFSSQNGSFSADEKMRITTSGNVGIGVTAPDVKLEVGGDVSIRSANYLYFGQYTNSVGSWATRMYALGGYHYFNANGFIFSNEGYSATEWMRITTAGNVGIGITNPTNKLEIATGNSATTGIRVRDSANGVWTDIYRATIKFFGGGGVIDTNDTTDAIDIRQAGNSRLFIAQSNSTYNGVSVGGWVGIGTSAPSQRLEVLGDLDMAGLKVTTTTGRGRITVASQTISYSSYLELNSGESQIAFLDGNYNSNRLRIATNRTGAYIAFETGAQSEKMRITSAGNVGIGTTNPTAQLEIGGTNPEIRLGPAGTSSGAYMSYNTAGNYFSLNAVTQGVGYRNLIFANDGGNVGIGTTSPADLLNIQGTNKNIRVTNTAAYNASGTAYLGFNGYYNSSNADSWFARIVSGKENTTDNDVRGYLSIQTNNPSSGIADRVRIDSNGNLGIGTTTPYDKLEVAGGIAATGYTTGNASQAHATLIGVNGGTSYLQAVDWGAEFKPLVIEGKTISLQTGTGSTSSRFYIDNSGNVGVGTTSPTSLFTVQGSQSEIHIKHDATRAITIGNWDGTAQYIKSINLGVALTPFVLQASRFTFDTGNVGIGTTSPTQKLYISTGGSNGGIVVDTGAGSTSAFIRLINSNQNWDVNTQTNNRFAIYDQTNSKQPFTIEPNTPSNTMWLAATGNVGIGTTTPSYKLHVVGDARIGTNAQRVYLFDDGNAHIHSGSGPLWLNAEDSSGIYINNQTNGSVYLTNGTGRVGIGTTSVSYNLEVAKASAGATFAVNADMSAAGEASIIAFTSKQFNTYYKAAIIAYDPYGGSWNRRGLAFCVNGTADGTSATYASDKALYIAPDKSSTFYGSVTIGGDLIINGTTTTVNSTVTTIDDPIITLGGDTAPTVDDNKDRGVEFKWHNGTAAKVGFFGFDDSTGYFTFIPDATNSSEVFSGTQGDIQASNFRGTLIGNSSTTTKLNVTDSRNTADTPETISMGVVADFKANATNSLSDGGTYNGVLTFRQYGSGTDWSGGRSHQLAFTDNDNIWHRSGTSTSWGTWYKIWHQNNDGAGSGLDADLLDGYNQDTANTTNTIVRRNASGNFSAGTITANSFALDGGFTISNSGAYGQTSTWLGMTGHGIYTTGTTYMDLDGTTSTYEIRGYNNDTFAKFENTGTANNARRISFLTNGGNFGIGQTSPNAKLHIGSETEINITNQSLFVQGSKTGYAGFKGLPLGQLFIYDDTASTAGSGGAIGFGANTGSSQRTWIASINSERDSATNDGSNYGGSLVFYTRPAQSTPEERLRITSTGNVGINNTAPYSSLSVKAQAVSWGEGILVDPASNGFSAIYFRTEANQNSSVTGTWAFGKNSSAQTGGEILHIVKNGLTGGALHRVDAAQSWKTTGETCFGFNVGIGFTTPDQPLAFADSVAMKIQLNGSNANGYQLGLAAAVNSGDAMMKFIAGETGAGEFGFYTTTNLRLLINKDGNVGIGTASPGYKLDVSGDARVTGSIRISTANTTGNGIIFADDGDIVDLNDAYCSMRISYGLRIYSQGGGGTTQFQFATSQSGAPTYLNAGNVGIGTTTPSVKLHVVGSSILANNTSIDPDAYGNTTIAGNIADGGGWGVGAAIGGNNGTGKSWAIGVSGDLYFGYQNGSANDTMQTFMQVGTNRNLFFVPVSGNVGIGVTTNPAYKLEVNGSFAATTKSFVIPHPTKEGKKLRYGSLEGPENGVYVRGKTTSKVIELPDYWTKLVDPESITVQLTPIGSHQKLYVEKIEDNKVYIANENLLAKSINCFFYILAERADVEKLQVEIDA